MANQDDLTGIDKAVVSVSSMLRVAGCRLETTRIANLVTRKNDPMLLITFHYFPIRYKNLSVLKMILSRTMAGVAFT
jgi:hypothetical protein